MRELYYEFAHDPGQPTMVRINAATASLNRIDGLPVAKVVTSQASDPSRMTDEELEAEHEQPLEEMRAARAMTTTFHGDPVPAALCEQVIADLASGYRALPMSGSPSAAQPAMMYSGAKTRSRARGRRRGCDLSRVYSHEAERVPCRGF